MIQGIFHVNINVSDFDRSLAFYKMLGFRVLRDLGTGGSKQLDMGLNLRNGRARAALLVLGDDPHATRIDLIEWTRPPPNREALRGSKPHGNRAHSVQDQASSHGIRATKERRSTFFILASGNDLGRQSDSFCLLPRP